MLKPENSITCYLARPIFCPELTVVNSAAWDSFFSIVLPFIFRITIHHNGTHRCLWTPFFYSLNYISKKWLLYHLTFSSAESQPRALQITACSCVVLSKWVLLRVIFCSCVIVTTLLCEKWQIACLSCQIVIYQWTQTWWSNDKRNIKVGGYRKISWLVNVSQISYSPQASASASANNWSVRHWQITIFCDNPVQ